MKTGFLLQQEECKQRRVVRTDSASEAGAAAQAAPPHSAALPPASTPEQAAVGLAECLQLLKGPSDERRYEELSTISLHVAKTRHLVLPCVPETWLGCLHVAPPGC